ncbi:MAG TPA: methionine gamma-lyase [Anaerolinea thermolimosa]|uniref:L-methionine gamma-lyase n=1 Tax=Anaerolinea thermolimosa TaxID=229919 RepID=A0A3D1JEQ5_9CHLR|nr:aminotransferase class I/II-fold pyridoxal phosphate-dependent enzyme [Anaerolinea thermolimosa]GAP08401.1 cystathionine beta-lyase [Anaerolinea thermolimosa]HCE16983.1 methionine gamma-lyase [Anaerolinea thermolimosa]
MTHISPTHGLGTLVNHIGEQGDPLHAHIAPIYQTSTFRFPDVESGAAMFRGEEDGFIYTRYDNPSFRPVVAKLAALEGLDLIHHQPAAPLEEVVSARLFSSGMAAITSAILACVQAGDTIIAQNSLYGATYNFLHDVAPRFGIRVVWVHDPSPAGWEAAFSQNPGARIAYAETPINPTLRLIDLSAVAEIAHHSGAWLFVDNTFASPYCQRPLSLGADVVLHATTKYLAGHGVVVGGAVISRHVGFIAGPLYTALKIYGGSPSPFDAWLTNLGLKTFELRMARHCANALEVARWLEHHPAVATVHYPGLESHPDHALARRQMFDYGGMVSFELKGGLEAGKKLMEGVRVSTLAVSLGNTDSLICHPASMTHSAVSPQDRAAMGISDGLVRFSVGIENAADLIADLEQALAGLA